MLIVDAQVHIWSSGKPTNATHRQVPAFTKDDLLKEMDEAGVDAAVIHPPSSWDLNSSVFWGTDITRMPCTWRQCVTMFTEEMPWLSGRDQELVMGRAVCDFIGWKIPTR